MADSDKQGSFEQYLTPIAVLAGALIIGGALAFGSGAARDNAQDGQQPKAVAVDIKQVSSDKSPFVGDPNAPVTIAVWYDYQCPFCKMYELNTLEQVYENYVKSGKVKIVYKDYQFLGEDSMTAGLFARAMWEAYPDKFHDWHKAVMNAQDAEHGGFGDLESIKILTATIPGVDVARVEKLMNDNKTAYLAAMEADRAEGAKFGINGTPGSIVGTTLLSGAESYARVSGLIEAELAK